eukprot:4192229-Alexandrium_andersonii.AAC.1
MSRQGPLQEPPCPADKPHRRCPADVADPSPTSPRLEPARSLATPGLPKLGAVGHLSAVLPPMP